MAARLWRWFDALGDGVLSGSGDVGRHPSPASATTAASFWAWVTELARGQSPATVQKNHRVLGLVLDVAVKDGRLVRNVATGVTCRDDLAEATGYPSDASKFSSMDTRTNDAYGWWCSFSPTPE